MEGESGVTQSIIVELHSWNIQRDQKKGESGVTRSIIDEHHSSDIQRHHVECESGVTTSSVDDFILRLSNEIMWNEKVVLLEVSLMNFILWIP